MINIAVLGAGYWGKNLIRNFDEIGALHTICDSNMATLRALQERYKGKKFRTACDAVFKDSNIDAVVIATPAETHYNIAKGALQAGKHVFVEKPLSLFVDEGKALSRLALQKGLKLMVGHILLYHPAIIKLKGIIDSGELGKIHYIYSNRLNLGKFRSEENILWSFAPHDISAFLYLLDESPVSVIAQGGSYLNSGIADVTISILSFKSGVKAHIFVSWLHPNKEQRLIVVGDKKMAVFDDTLTEEKLKIHDKGVDWVNRLPVPRRNDAEIIPIETYEPLKAECSHFIECIEKGVTPKTDGSNGIDVLEVLNACQKSLEQEGMPVSLKGNSSHQSCFVHKTSIIDQSCRIGPYTKIWHFSHIMPDVKIGKGCSIGQNVFVGRGVRIGNNVKIQNNVSVYDGVSLEDDVFCGPSMVFTNVINPRSHVSRKSEFKRTTVKKGATIGANATVLCGHTIGCYAFVGAGAVVTKDVPNHALVIGNPARRVGWMCECGCRLYFMDSFATCEECGKRYTKSGNTVKSVEDRTSDAACSELEDSPADKYLKCREAL